MRIHDTAPLPDAAGPRKRSYLRPLARGPSRAGGLRPPGRREPARLRREIAAQLQEREPGRQP